MLVLSRKRTEEFVIDLRKHGLGTLSVFVVDIRGDKVRLGVNAPGDIPVHRREVFDAITQEEDRPPMQPAE